MGNLLDNLKNLLQKDDRLISEGEPRRTGSAVQRGELLKNKIIELAIKLIKLDKDLIELLLSNEQMREVFFVEVFPPTLRAEAKQSLIFDKDTIRLYPKIGKISIPSLNINELSVH